MKILLSILLLNLAVNAQKMTLVAKGQKNETFVFAQEITDSLKLLERCTHDERNWKDVLDERGAMEYGFILFKTHSPKATNYPYEVYLQEDASGTLYFVRVIVDGGLDTSCLYFIVKNSGRVIFYLEGK